MKKISLFLIPVFVIATAIPAFCAVNMNKDKLAESVKNCTYFRTYSFVNNQNTGSTKVKEKVEGYVNGKCRYVVEYHYQSGETKGMICDLNSQQQEALYYSKLKKASKSQSNTGSKNYMTVPCTGYNLINNQWIKDEKPTSFSIER